MHILHHRVGFIQISFLAKFVSVAIVMLKNRLLMSLVTGGVGFGLSLLILRDFKGAAYTGLMGFIGSQAAVLVTSSQHESHLRDRRAELREHIHTLQRRRAEIYEDLTTLQTEYTELSTQLQPQQTANQGQKSAVAAQINPWQPQSHTTQPVSWNLTQPHQSTVDREINELELRIQALLEEESDLQASITAAFNAKQTAELQRTTSEAELQQLQAQISEQEALKQTLNQTILELEQQQQQLQSSIPQLYTQIQELEEYRTVLEQETQAGAPATTSPGAEALQLTIDQMQSQIGALGSELGEIEAQILDRRNQKQLLDQAIEADSAIANRQIDVAPAPHPATPPSASTRLPEMAAPQPRSSPGANSLASFTATKSPASSGPAVQQNAPKAKLPKAKSPKAQEDGLSEEWIAFKRQLQPHEFQALCAIALEENPTSVLKHLAENNLTMPEMLIDTINEQALDAIGDLILEAGHDASSTIIAQEYRDEVATLIATHR